MTQTRRLTLLALMCLTLTPGCDRLSGSVGSLGGSVGSLGSLGSGSLGGRPATATRQPVAVRPLVPENLKVREQDTRLTAARITGAELTPTPGGYILRATATPPAPGSYNAALVESGRSGSTMVVTFRMAGTPGTRLEPAQVTAGGYLSREDLNGITRIEVRGTGNTLVVRK